MKRANVPQYAAEALAHFKRMVDTLPVLREAEDKGIPLEGIEPKHIMQVESCKIAADFLATAVHVVLPHGGEIYRENFPLWSPSAEEVESFAGLPAPVTSFEFEPAHLDDRSKAITIVVDLKQLNEDQSGVLVYRLFKEKPPSDTYWVPSRYATLFETPLNFTGTGRYISVVGRHFYTSSLRAKQEGSLTAELTPGDSGVALHYLLPVIQCCHALRAKATLEETTDLNEYRREKLRKAGAPYLVYHVLKLPKHAQQGSGPSGSSSHDSPRFHVRRAHIRKLPTGALAFVRQCFVGDRAKGVVEKHYEVGA